ncbi:ComEA family DNA-binding protein [Naumannella halotolerans]|nr:ComEA family DNA-binding protein [Naumannella halotolerans]
MADLFGDARVTDRVRQRLEEMVAGSVTVPVDDRVRSPDHRRPDTRSRRRPGADERPRRAVMRVGGEDPDDRPTEVLHPDPDWLAEVATLRRRRADADGTSETAAARPRPAGVPRLGQEPPAGEVTDPVAERWPPGRRRFTALHVVVLLVLVGLLVGVFGFRSWLNRPVPIEAVAVPAATGSVAAAPTAEASVTQRVTVHVLGEVEEPGVVELAAGSRVDDALAAAGGLSEGADPAELNLAQPLSDGQQIVVGSSSEPAGEVRGGGDSGGGDNGATTGAEGSGTKININTATAGELEALPGVGPKTAAKIIAWRTEQGPFASIEELQDVSGIGPKTYAELAPLISV